MINFILEEPFCGTLTREEKFERYSKIQISIFVKTFELILEILLYKKYGYILTIPTYPFVTVKSKYVTNCTWEFTDWLEQQKKRANRRPKAYIPDVDQRDFLSLKYSGVSYKYSDDRIKLNMTFKSWENIADIVTWHSRDVLRLVDDMSGISMHYAMRNFYLTGKRGLVLAGDHPIVEVQAIQNGASRILSIGQTPHETNDISSLSLVEFAENHRRYNQAFDFVATYGIIETVGLGRYGDVLDAFGDLQMMAMLGCSLKKGGLFFLGTTIGRDAVIFNQNRIYGHARLPMLISGFEWIATFSEDSETSIEITGPEIDRLHKFDNLKRTLVLRKL
uniref:Methyltransferase n=2 Tax=Caenorhabditis tropicalis TaxID=1561998 RepID=A0A1I7TAX2_9PELO